MDSDKTWNELVHAIQEAGFGVEPYRGVRMSNENTRGRHFAPKGVTPQIQFHDIDLHVEIENAMVTDDVAAVTLSIMLNDVTWRVDGSAKRDPKDRPNHEIGLALATARAVQRFANQLHRQANGMVRNAEWIELDHTLRRKEGLSASKWAGTKRTKKKNKKGKLPKLDEVEVPANA